jgi:hypothetical protein
MRLQDISPELQTIVRRELREGEQIAWLGMPVPTFFTSGVTGVFLFGVAWTAGALFMSVVMMRSAIQSKVDPAGLFWLGLFFLAFVLIGATMSSAPFWAYRSALRTVYLITDQRAVIFDGRLLRTTRRYPPDKLCGVYRVDRPNGISDIVFERIQRAGRMTDDRSERARYEDIGFLRIRNGKEVEAILRRLAGPKRPV